MFSKVVKTFADAIAAAVAREVAKQLPTIAEKIAVAVADRVLEKLPDLGDIHSVADFVERIVDELVRRLPKIKIPFLT